MDDERCISLREVAGESIDVINGNHGEIEIVKVTGCIFNSCYPIMHGVALITH